MEEEVNKVYIGQSTTVLSRIKQHNQNKEFWSEGILFITDNNSFTKLTIDYLEHKFINVVKEGTYDVINKELRTKTPNFSEFDEPIFLEFYEQILFLLKGLGHDLNKKEKYNIKQNKVYTNKEENASVTFIDGKFVLLSGSILKEIDLENRKGSESYINLINQINKRRADLLEQGKIIEEEGVIKTVSDIEASSISYLGNLVTGRSTNGYDYFIGSNELRQ